MDYCNTQYTEIYNSDSDKHIYKQDKNAFYVDGELKKTMNTLAFSSDYNLYLLASHQAYNNIDNIGTEIKLYHCKIWDNGVLICDFVPCFKKTTNKRGLYNLVNNEFYTNANNTGEDFGVGSIVFNSIANNTKEYTRSNMLPMTYKKIEYIEGTGTQYINTGFYPHKGKYIMEAKIKSVRGIGYKMEVEDDQ